MREQPARDQVTVEIATGVALFVLILVSGALAMWLVQAAGGELDGFVARIAGLAIFLIALMVSIRFVYRHRTP